MSYSRYSLIIIAMVTATAVLVPWSFSVLWFDLGIGWLWGAIGAWMVVRAATLLWRYQSDAWAVTGATRGWPPCRRASQPKTSAG